MRAAQKGGKKVLERTSAAPDPQEEQALHEAAAALHALLPGVQQTDRVASAVITAWIMSRCRQAAGQRLTENIVFDHNNAKLKGVVAAALPQIGAALSGLPADTPLFALSKEDVIRVFLTGHIAIREALIAADEAPDFIELKHLKEGDDCPF